MKKLLIVMMMTQGQKWAANLWVWNGPRNGYWRRNSLTGKNEKPVAQSISASFESKDVVGAKLYWEDQVHTSLLHTMLPLLSMVSCAAVGGTDSGAAHQSEHLRRAQVERANGQ